LSNNDAPHGFKIWEKLLGAHYYCVPTAPTINVMVNDLVLADNTSVATGKLGQLQSIYDAAVLPTTTGATNPVIGSVLECFDENMDPVKYIAAGEVGDGTVAGYLLVADDPNQLFEAQEDGATAAIEAADIGLHFEVTSTTLSAGNTTTGLSYQEIDSNAHNTTATIPVKVLRMAYPLEDTIGSAGCRWVCKINPDAHINGQGTAV
jgi:hypothetical protein